MIAEAIANTALAITKVMPNPIAIAGVAAIGAAQIAIIAAEMGQSGDAPDAPTVNRRDVLIDSAVRDLRQIQWQPILVTEDLNVVQGRVSVTADRSSLG